jgi:DNA-binding SARP family transcriptional activator
VLWGEEPPRSCLALIHGYAAQVRGLLEPRRKAGQASRALVCARGGYRLALDREQVDLTRFDDLTHAATQAQREGDSERALERYGQALDCWRGRVLADGPARLRQHPTAIAAAHRRIITALAYADLALDLGHDDLAAAQLRPLIAAEPLHEGMHARLMLALYHLGEQAAALQLFAELRDRLADELGIEPGAEATALLLTRVAERDSGQTWRNINRQLGRISQVTLASPAGTVVQTTPPTAEQEAIYQALSLQPPARVTAFDPA